MRYYKQLRQSNISPPRLVIYKPNQEEKQQLLIYVQTRNFKGSIQSGDFKKTKNRNTINLTLSVAHQRHYQLHKNWASVDSAYLLANHFRLP